MNNIYYIHRVIHYCVELTHANFMITFGNIVDDINKLKKDCEKYNRRDYYNGLMIMYENAKEQEVCRYDFDRFKAHYYKIQDEQAYKEFEELVMTKTDTLKDYCNEITGEISDLKEYIRTQKLKFV